MGSLRLSAGIICFTALACGSAAGAAVIINGLQSSRTLHSPAPVRSANGKLEHMFSIPFVAAPSILPKINGLESLTVARTSTGGAIKIVLDHGVPYPTKAISVEVIEDAGVDASRVIDPLRPPSAMPPLSGHRLISTFRVPGRNSYLAAWRNVRSGESSLTVWDESTRAGQPMLIATSSSRILGAAVQLSPHNLPELTIVVWTTGRTAGDVVAGMYRWIGQRS